MPDLSSQISQLKAIRDSGATSGTVDGQAVSFRSSDELASTIAQLQQQDTSVRRRRRSRVRTLNLGSG
jgi:hypothetical protein